MVRTVVRDYFILTFLNVWTVYTPGTPDSPRTYLRGGSEEVRDYTFLR